MERAAAGMSWLVRALVAMALLAMMVITCLDVIGRYLINRPLPGAAELVQYLLIATIFIALPLVTLRHEHISISLIDSVLGSGARRVQRALVSGASAVVVAMLCHRLWLHAQMLAENRDVIGFLNLPVAPAAYLASIFTGLTACVLGTVVVAELIGKGPLRLADQGQGASSAE